jgi:hypothetical protein
MIRIETNSTNWEQFEAELEDKNDSEIRNV